MNDLVEKRTKSLLYIAFAFVAFYFSTLLMQTYEKDPLSVKPSTEEERFVVAAGDSFVFSRQVCTEKDLAVTVHREFHNTETGNKFMLAGVRYVAYASDSCYETEFLTQTPLQLERGEYEYRPILIYNVNNIKTITKPAPKVFVTVN